MTKEKIVLKHDESKRQLINYVVSLSDAQCGALRIYLMVLVPRFFSHIAPVGWLTFVF